MNILITPNENIAATVVASMMGEKAKLRLEFYRLFYTIVFMRKHSMTTANSQKVIFNVQQLKNMFDQSLMRILE